MRYDSEHKGQTRLRILKEAAAAIRAEGPAQVSVVTLMSRAGLTHGGFYAHFKSKDDLLAEAIDHMFEEVQLNFFSESGRSAPRSVLSKYISHYLSMAHRDARTTGCPVPILAGDFHRLPERARARFNAGVGRMTARIVVLLESAGVKDAQERSESAIAEMVGAISLARVTDDGAAATLLAFALKSVRCKFLLNDNDT